MAAPQPIAIVGIGGLFPDAPTLDAYWHNIASKHVATRPAPADRWSLAAADVLAEGPQPDKTYSPNGCTIDNIPRVTSRLDLDPSLLSKLDPLYHLVLHVGLQAFESAVTDTLDRDRVGVTLAAIALPTDASSAFTRGVLGRSLAESLSRDGVTVERPAEPDVSPWNTRVCSLPAALLATGLGLRGGSLTLDAACASSLYAIKLACDELHAGRADAMLAGGVSRPDCLYTQMGFAQLQALSRSGVCRPFDARADGLIVGEGAGIVVLKRLDDALRDGDEIHGVIRGIGLSNDMAGSLLAADRDGQLRAMRAAYEQAGWRPSDVDLIECHGTGTPLGDAVELESLRALWADADEPGASEEAVTLGGVGFQPACAGWKPAPPAELTPTRTTCAIGSVKSNIGHLLTAAGAAGLIKVLLAMRAETLPPMVNFESHAAETTLAGTRLHVQTDAETWRQRNDETPRRAAVSAFGFGGINAHLLVEQWDPKQSAQEQRTAESRHSERSEGSSRKISTPSQAAALLRTERAEPIAIVGLAARFGELDNIEAIRNAIQQSAPKASPRPADRWRGCDEIVKRKLTNADKPGAYIDAIAIEPGEFRLPPNEIAEVLPQQLLMLQTVAAALDDAGLPRRAPRPRAGVFLGMGIDPNTSNYHQRWVLLNWAREWARRLDPHATPERLAAWVNELRDAVSPPLSAGRVLGSLGNIIASRIAREFGCGGPSFALSCDEASGPRAIELGMRALQRGELDTAIVGAVDLTGDVRNVIAADTLRRNGRTNGAGNESFVGEGAGAFVLRRLSDAVADGDPIYGVIRGIGIAGGDAPGGDHEVGARLAKVRAYADADIEPDADEIVAETVDAKSTESIFGYAGAATGIASLVQAALSLGIESESSVAKRIGISTATLDGNCTHVVLESDEVSSAAAANTKVQRRRASDRSERKQASSAAIVVRTGGPTPNLRLPEPTPAPQRRVASEPVPAVAAAASRTSTRIDPFSDLAPRVAEAGVAVARAHEWYLHASQSALRDIGEAITFEAQLLGATGGEPRMTSALLEAAPSFITPPTTTTTLTPSRATPSAPPPIFPYEACLEFARGRVASVFGPLFAEVDTFPVRVRLPDEPLMLVHRVLSIAGEANSMTSGTVVTEHDVRPDAWYLDGGRAPVCISVEAGQADMFLCSWLGIDLRVRGSRTYRLLDAEITFHRGLPAAGDTIRYDIAIDRFVRNGDAWLFFFRFDGTIDGQPLLSMRNGCAGFFTEQEIENSGGIVLPPEERKPQPRSRPADWVEFVPPTCDSFSAEQLDAFRHGDPAACFGEAFANLPLRNPVGLPDGRMRLVHRIAALERDGGRFGLGLVRGEADVRPDDWFLTCHFIDDMVMPGTLMYECCAHTLRVLLASFGWIGESDEIHYEPTPGVPAALRCRGPVTPATRMVTYEVEIKEIGFKPEPYVIADAIMHGDGRPIVRFTDMSMQLSGMTRERLMELWGQTCHSERSEESCPERSQIPRCARNDASAGASASSQTTAPIGDAPLCAHPKPAIYDRDRILAFAIGDPSFAFGEPYRVFDHDRRIARLPGPPYDLMHRVTELAAEPWKLEAGVWVEGQYDVPPDAWYFRANRQRSMPYCILLEIALQTCGWLAAHGGSALRSPRDLSFRNLGGTATLHEELFADAGTLTTRIRQTDVSQAGDMILLRYDMQLWRGDRLIFDGDTQFGFFTATALAEQVGVRDARPRMYEPTEQEIERGERFALQSSAPLTPDHAGDAHFEGAALPGDALRMIDRVELLSIDGGPHGLGFVRGTKKVDPREWFFAAHFYQDPVCPGSLGLESFLQLLKIVALRRWPSLAATHRFEPITVGRSHEWKYRGQVIPTNDRVTVDAAITEIHETPAPTLIAHGFLSVDGTTIYEMTDFGIRLVPDVAR